MIFIEIFVAYIAAAGNDNLTIGQYYLIMHSVVDIPGFYQRKRLIYFQLRLLHNF